MEIVGQRALLIDREPIPQRGKALPASTALLRRVTTALGPGGGIRGEEMACISRPRFSPSGWRSCIVMSW